MNGGHHSQQGAAGFGGGPVLIPSTWNQADKHPEIVLSNGDVTAASIAGIVWKSVRGTIAKSVGNLYWEANIDTAVLNACVCGLGNSSAPLNSFCGSDANGWGQLLQPATNSSKFHSGSSSGKAVPAFATSDVRMCFAWSAALGFLWFGVEGNWRDGDPATLLNPSFSGVNGLMFPMTGISWTGIAHVLSLFTVDSDFDFPPPAGFNDRFAT